MPRLSRVLLSLPVRCALGAGAFALPLAAQEIPSQVATRTEKADYLPAVALCKEAVELTGSDPRTAVDKLTEVIDNPKIKKVECLLRIELRPSEYTTPYEFTPYRYRGQAGVELAGRDAANAVRHLQRAAEDFQKSVEAGVTASGDLLKAAQAELAKAKTAAASTPSAGATTAPPAAPVVSPVDAFSAEWQPLVTTGKFKSALALLAARGAALPQADRQRFEQETRQRSQAFVADPLSRFRRELDRIADEADLRAMTDSEFDRAFVLAPPDELVDPPPAYGWARATQPVLAEIRAGKSTGAALLKAAADAAPLAEQGEPQWFQMTERLAQRDLEAALRKEVQGARDLARPERDAARKRADALLGRWKAFADGLKPALLAAQPDVGRHGKALEDLLGGFPVELKELAAVDLGACFTAADPDAALRKVRDALDAMDRPAGPPLAKESRQLLYSRLVTVGALQALLAGKTEDEAAADLQAYKSKLQAAGGPLDAKAYGPRVEKVFLRLAQGG